MPTEPHRSGTMIAVATFRGLIYVTDATDAEQPFVSFGRAQHILSNGKLPHAITMRCSSCHCLCHRVSPTIN